MCAAFCFFKNNARLYVVVHVLKQEWIFAKLYEDFIPHYLLQNYLVKNTLACVHNKVRLWKKHYYTTVVPFLGMYDIGVQYMAKDLYFWNSFIGIFILTRILWLQMKHWFFDSRCCVTGGVPWDLTSRQLFYWNAVTGPLDIPLYC